MNHQNLCDGASHGAQRRNGETLPVDVADAS